MAQRSHKYPFFAESLEVTETLICQSSSFALACVVNQYVTASISSDVARKTDDDEYDQLIHRAGAQASPPARVADIGP